MTKINRKHILEQAVELYAKSGFETFSIRNLAKKVGISHSVIYHYFKNEENLLKEMFDFASLELGKKRHALPVPESAVEMLKQRVAFQIDNSENIVAVLKYYISHRPHFEKNTQGFIPDKSTLHIEEVLIHGINSKEFIVENIQEDAKVIAHAINGFLLEYYPYTPKGKEKDELVDRICRFLLRSLKGGTHDLKE